MDRYDIFFICFLVIFTAFCAGFACYSIGHEKGYLQGNQHTQIFYETTGEFPSQIWLQENEGEHITDTKQIKESLDKFLPITYGE